MQLDDFKRILGAFADQPTDLDVSKGTLVVQLRDEVLEATISLRGGDLVVAEAGVEYPAAKWITHRVAQLPQLADRILSFVAQPENFVTPAAALLDEPNFAIAGAEIETDNAVSTAQEIVGRRLAGMTSVLFLTSDAGEGKTTTIQQLALIQARLFKEKQTDWLLVPVPLGGRTFLRFDDVVVAALMNRLRFQYWYYEAFLELVRLGVVVPAFDGFEEMIIEGSSGEAISAVGSLVNQLKSSGSVLLAARKAFFDYQSFRTQARLFDAIGKDWVSFARLALHRWSRSHFLEYSQLRGLENAEGIYEAISGRLHPDHPLLTRAVLVRRLIDVAKDANDLGSLLTSLGHEPQDYFYQFVNALVEREAREKWPDKYGDPPKPLLSVAEHHQLLGLLAQEMWYASTDALRLDVVGLVVELFCEQKDLPPQTTRQIRERLKQHSLLITALGGSGVAFDHEDFRSFYLGEALGRTLSRGEQGELRGFLQVASLPEACVEQACLSLHREQVDKLKVINSLQLLASSERPTSFVRENAGVLSVRLLALGGIRKQQLKDMHFPSDSLKGLKLKQIEFVDCHFQPTSLAKTELSDCSFQGCRFERIEVEAGNAIKATLSNCQVDSLTRIDRDDQLFDPAQIRTALARYGFSVVDDVPETERPVAAEPDEETKTLERALRAFMRSTQVNESVFRLRLGVKANLFQDRILPDLLQVGVLEPVPYLGSGVQHRYRMRVTMSAVEEALAASGGQYQVFLQRFTVPPK